MNDRGRDIGLEDLAIAETQDEILHDALDDSQFQDDGRGGRDHYVGGDDEDSDDGDDGGLTTLEALEIRDTGHLDELEEHEAERDALADERDQAHQREDHALNAYYREISSPEQFEARMQRALQALRSDPNSPVFQSEAAERAFLMREAAIGQQARQLSTDRFNDSFEVARREYGDEAFNEAFQSLAEAGAREANRIGAMANPGQALMQRHFGMRNLPPSLNSGQSFNRGPSRRSDGGGDSFIDPADGAMVEDRRSPEQRAHARAEQEIFDSAFWD